jgi:hypothetical protein
VCALRRWYCTGAARALRSALDIEIFDRAADLDGRWTRISAGKSILFDPACLGVFACTGPDEAIWRYVLLSMDGIPAAAMVTQLVTVSDAQLSVEQDRARGMVHAMKRMRNHLLGAMGRRVLVLGNLFSAGPYGVVLAPEADAARVWASVPGVVELLRKGNAIVPPADFVLVKDFATAVPGSEVVLGAQGFGRLHTEPVMTMEVSPAWQSLRDYLQDLRFKYRKAARLTIQRCEAANCVLKGLSAAEMAGAAERLYALYQQVEARADTRFGVLQPTHLPELARLLGPERFRCTGIFRDHLLVGFTTLFKDGNSGVAHIVGFDYAVNAEIPLYHRLLLALIEDAIAMQCDTLHFGRTALEAKARLGAVPHPAHVYVRHRSPVLNGAARVLLNSVPQRRATARHVFRSAEGH